MSTAPESITVNGVEYFRPRGLDPAGRKIVRSRDAGVFFGLVTERDGDHVTMSDARRIWYWAGAASLSQLAMSGTTRPADCKFPEAVECVELFGVCEILDVSDEAAASIDAVKVWKS